MSKIISFPEDLEKLSVKVLKLSFIIIYLIYCNAKNQLNFPTVQHPALQ